DAVDVQELLLRRLLEVGERVDVLREEASGRRSDVGDRERDEEALERDPALLRDLREEVLDALLAPALEVEELRLRRGIAVEVEDVRRRREQSRVDELRDLLLPDAVDLERAAAGEDQRPP